jgi:NAD(P)-dependent dehydrogenase (short-subunit alcohol dehydrogenase family)
MHNRVEKASRKMRVKLADRTALVTGGAVRIGRAIVEALADEGCGVVVHVSRSRDAGTALVERLRSAGARAWLVEGDLSDERGCRGVLAAAWERAGRLDILVNNAAVFHKDTLRTASGDAFRNEFAVNTWAPILLTQDFAVRLEAWDRAAGRKPGGAPAHVVNLLDRRITGDDGSCVPYLLSKKALADFTRLAALEYAPRIAVNAVAPGAILPPPGEGGDPVADKAGRALLETPCRPADVAAAVVYLVTSETIAGQTLLVDGGQHLLR